MKNKIVAAATFLESRDEDYISAFDGCIVDTLNGCVYYNDNADKNAILYMAKEVLSKYLQEKEDYITSDIHNHDGSLVECLPNCDVYLEYKFSIYCKRTPSDGITPDEYDEVITDFEFTKSVITIENGNTFNIN